MQRFILTGAPGSGKTSIIRQLELDGFSVVEEAATDIIALQQRQGIAEPWTNLSFIDAVTLLQRERQLSAASQSAEIQFHDRSVVCTVTLAKYLEHPIPDILNRELNRIRKERIFEQRVFFIQNLGFITPTEARRISFRETLRFEKMHEEAYREFGFKICYVPAGRLSERVSAIKKAIAAK
jgi:predicted ATPase